MGLGRGTHQQCVVTLSHEVFLFVSRHIRCLIYEIRMANGIIR